MIASHAAVAGGIATTVVLTAAADGGYFPHSWGWLAVALLGFTAIAAVLTNSTPEPLALALPGTLAALGLIQLVAGDDPSRVLEAERTLAYVAVGLAAATALRRSFVSASVAGISIGCWVIAAYALLTRLLPDRLGSLDDVAVYRLAQPLGYWNALAILTVIGILLTIGAAGPGRTTVSAALASAALPVLLTTLYFTYSRGGWAALGLGLGILVLLHPSRGPMFGTIVALAPVPAFFVWIASRQSSLTAVAPDLSRASEQGRTLLLWLAVATVTAGFVGALLPAIGRRLDPSARARRALRRALILGVVGLLALLLVRVGDPLTAADEAWGSFSSPPPEVRDLNERLFTFSSNGRVDLWSAAWTDYTAHPLLGSGAGSFERFWLENRTVAAKVRDAHSLYLEMLAELGPLGLLVLLVALLTPVAVVLRSRRSPVVAGVGAAYVAYLAHAGVDWDWEVPVVTGTAVLLGAVLIVEARASSTRLHLDRPSHLARRRGGPARCGCGRWARRQCLTGRRAGGSRTRRLGERRGSGAPRRDVGPVVAGAVA